MEPSLAVVVPLFNHELFIEEALKSVLENSVSVSEIILIDDGSKDDGLRIATQFAENEPKIKIISNANQGAPATINEAISISNSKWIAILNSDDRFSPTKIEHCMEIAFNNPDVSFIAGGINFIDVHGNSLEEIVQTDWYERATSIYRQTGNLFVSLLEENFLVTTSNFVFTRDLWHSLGGFNDLRYCHDLDFALRAMKSFEVFVDLGYIHVEYRIHEKNTIAENIENIRLERCIVLIYHALHYGLSRANIVSKFLFRLKFKSIIKRHRFSDAHNFFKDLYESGDSLSEFQKKCLERLLLEAPDLNLRF